MASSPPATTKTGAMGRSNPARGLRVVAFCNIHYKNLKQNYRGHGTLSLILIFVVFE
jgi:hypothetical protein